MGIFNRNGNIEYIEGSDYHLHIYNNIWDDNWVNLIDGLKAAYSHQPNGTVVAAMMIAELKQNRENWEVLIWHDPVTNKPVAFLPLMIDTSEKGKQPIRRVLIEDTLSWDRPWGWSDWADQRLPPDYKKVSIRHDVIVDMSGPTSPWNHQINSAIKKLAKVEPEFLYFYGGFGQAFNNQKMEMQLYHGWRQYCRTNLDPLLDYTDDISDWDFCGSTQTLFAYTKNLLAIHCYVDKQSAGLGYYTWNNDEVYWICSRRNPDIKYPVGHWLTLKAAEYTHAKIINLGLDSTSLHNKVETWGGKQNRPIYGYERITL